MSNNNLHNNNRSRPLAQNNRFDCLRTDDSPNSSSRYSSPNRERKYCRDNSRYENSLLRGRFSFMTEKKEPKKKNQLNLKKERFPSLIDLKNIHKNKKEGHVLGNYKEKATYTEEEIQKIKKVKQQQKERESLQGWISIANNNGTTQKYDIDHRGRKVKISQEINYDDDEPYDHEKFQSLCAVAMYKNLKAIQNVRDEENEILGPHSQYYNKGSLTDLSYISDDDVVTSDENDASNSENDYDSDIDTY